MGSIRGRIKRMIDALGMGYLFDHANMKDLARHGFLSREHRDRRKSAPLNVRKLAAVMGMKAIWCRLNDPDKRANGLAKLGLSDPVTPDEIRARMTDLARDEMGCTDAEVEFLEKRLT